MAEIHKISIALTGEQISELRMAVDAGEYATTSEVVREAVREWQRKRKFHPADVKRLQRLWDERKASGGRARPLDFRKLRIEARKRLAIAKKKSRIK